MALMGRGSYAYLWWANEIICRGLVGSVVAELVDGWEAGSVTTSIADVLSL